MRSGWWFCLVGIPVAGGCVYPTLGDVPVIGGSPEARAIAREELARFDQWVGPGRVHLREVRFVEEREGLGGQYRRGAERVDLDWDSVDGQPAVERYSLRHELCHALDLQEGLLANATAPFDALAAAADPGAFTDSEGQRGRRSEVMAYLCTPGPWATITMSRACPGDAPEVDAVGRWFAEQVWLGEPDVAPAGALDATTTAAPLHAAFPIDDLHFAGLTDGSLRFWLRGGASATEDLRVDAWSGVALPGAAPMVESAVDLPAWPDGLDPDDPVAAQRGAVDGGAAVVWTRRPNWMYLDLEAAPRLLARDESGWKTVDRCTGPVAAVTSTADQLWVGWAAGHDAYWAPIAAE